MFAEEQARGRTRTVDPEHDTIQPLERNYSAPTPMTPMRPPGHHRRSPPSLSVDPTTTSSPNRTSDGVLSPSSDHQAAVGPTTRVSGNPSSSWDISPSIRRLQLIQSALDEDLGSRPVQGPASVGGTPLSSNGADTPSPRSLTPRTGPLSSSGTRPLQRAATASQILFRANPKTYSPASASRTHESAQAPIGLDARTSSASHEQSSRTNINLNNITGARTSNPTAASPSRPSSSSRGLQRTSPHTTARLAASDSSYARPRAVIRTPEWISPYPTARTPSPDSGLSPETRSSSTRPSDELLSPLINMNLNSFSLEDHSLRESRARNTQHPTRSTPRRANPLSPSVVSQQSAFTHAFTEPAIHLDARIRQIEINHNFDPRSPILNRQRVPELAYERCFSLSYLYSLATAIFLKRLVSSVHDVISFARPSPHFIERPLINSPLSDFPANGMGRISSSLFRH